MLLFGDPVMGHPVVLLYGFYSCETLDPTTPDPTLATALQTTNLLPATTALRISKQTLRIF